LLLASSVQVVILLLVHIYGTVKSASVVKRAHKKLRKSLDSISLSPRAAKEMTENASSEKKTEEANSSSIPWLLKATVFEAFLFILASVTTTSSWFQLRCSPRIFSVSTSATFFDQIVTYYNLFEVCFEKPYPNGDCFDYDENVVPFDEEKRDTFDPLAALVFMSILTHLTLLTFFIVLSTVQRFSRQMKGTILDRSLQLQNNLIPIATACLSSFAAVLHLLSLIVLATSDVYHSEYEDLTFCSNTFGVDDGDGLDLIDGIDLGLDDLFQNEDEATATISQDVTRGVGPALVLTAFLLVFSTAEVGFIISSYQAAFEPSCMRYEEGSIGAGSPKFRGGHGGKLSGIAEIPSPRSPASSSDRGDSPKV